MFSSLEEALSLFGLTDTDEKVFETAENLRQSIRNSGRTVAYKDFGAGTPDMCLTEEQMYLGRSVEKPLREVCGWGMKGDWARFMYGVTKFYRPEKVLELGTCCGFSSAYMAKGYADSLIVTLEGAPEISAIAEEVHGMLDCRNIKRAVGRFQDVLPDVLGEYGHFDIAFIDGHHAEDATVRYFELIAPYAKGSLLIFDDISWSDGMKRAWERIQQTENVKEYADLGKIGVVRLKADAC